MEVIERIQILDKFKEFGVKKKSKIFLLPLVSDNIRLGEFSEYLVDCNLDKDKIQIVIIFDNSQENEGFKGLIYKLYNHHSYLDSDYIDDGSCVKLNFKVSKEYKEDFYKFIEGKYSQFSDKFKERLLKFNGSSTTHPNKIQTSLWDILYPSEDKRKKIAEGLEVDLKLVTYELFPPPDIIYEKYMDIKDLRKQLALFEEAKKDI